MGVGFWETNGQNKSDRVRARKGGEVSSGGKAEKQILHKIIQHFVYTTTCISYFIFSSLSLKLESLQKTIYQLEEQLQNEMQLKDEMEQKFR